MQKPASSKPSASRDRSTLKVGRPKKRVRKPSIADKYISETPVERVKDQSRISRPRTFKSSEIKEALIKDTQAEWPHVEPKETQKEKTQLKGSNSKETQDKRIKQKGTQARKILQIETQEKTSQRKETRSTRTPIKEELFNNEIQLKEDQCEEVEVESDDFDVKDVKINLKRCMYKVVENVATSLRMEIIRDDDENWDVYWSDYSISTVKSKTMTLHQRINHFPGMANLESKAFLAYHLNRMRSEFPQDYNFFPGSWSLPYQHQDCVTYVENHPAEVYILKPSRGAEGKGIKIFSNVEEVKSNATEAVCQMYMSNLLLLDKFKFDLRVYVLITCIDPLQIFVYNDGLVRLATCPYSAPDETNMNNQYMHLTNYSINKSSDTYDLSEEGSKRDFTTFNRWLLSKVLDGDKLWKDIDDIIIKTVISIHPILKEKYEELFPTHYKHNISACFEVLGFDIIIDNAMKPYLLEVNRSPSFNITGEVDERVKRTLIEDTFRLMNLQSTHTTSRNQASQMGNYRLIYPTAKSYEYSKFVHFIFTVPDTSEEKRRRKHMV